MGGAGAALVLAVSSMVGCRCISDRHQAAAAVPNDGGLGAPAIHGSAGGGLPGQAPPSPPSTTVVQEIFSGGLKNDWQDYGWTDREIKGPGPARLRFANWGGWIIAHKDTAGTFGAVVF